MTDETASARRGRPAGSATGRTPLRTVKIAAVWDRGQELAAAQEMTMTAYVEDALRRQNARVEKLLAQRPAE